MKEPDKVGIDTIKEGLEGAKITKNEYYNPDPSGIRTGNGPGPSFVETLDRVSIDAENVLAKVCDVLLEIMWLLYTILICIQNNNV